PGSAEPDGGELSVGVGDRLGRLEALDERDALLQRLDHLFVGQAVGGGLLERPAVDDRDASPSAAQAREVRGFPGGVSPIARPPPMILFSVAMIVGRPAPAAIATWSKPKSTACSAVTVPPNRTPPTISKRRRRARVRCTSVRKFLSHRTVMPYSETPPKPTSGRSSSSREISAESRIGRIACPSPPVQSAGSGSIFKPSMPTTPN